jgi:hypothetical protein
MSFETILASEVQTAQKDGIDASEIFELFESATPKQRVVIFERTLETGVLDDEYAFEFLTAIREDCGPDKREGMTAYVGFLNQLREKAPELFKESSHYYHRDLISFAIIKSCWDDLPALLTDYSSGTHLDQFTMVIAQLKYHGQVRILGDAMKTAYPKIVASTEYVPWASQEFASKLIEVMLVDYLQTAANPHPDDAQFLKATASISSWKNGWLEWFIPTITQPEPTKWKQEDFTGDLDSEVWQQKFATMQIEFIATQWRSGIPLARGLLGWRKWGEIFQAQFKNAKILSRHQKRGQKVDNSSLQRYLVPQAGQMDETLAESFSLTGGEPYEVAAALEIIPAYLDFLVGFGLIQLDEKQQAFQQIKPLVRQIPQALKYYECDPIAIENMLAAWE